LTIEELDVVWNSVREHRVEARPLVSRTCAELAALAQDKRCGVGSHALSSAPATTGRPAPGADLYPLDGRLQRSSTSHGDAAQPRAHLGSRSDWPDLQCLKCWQKLSQGIELPRAMQHPPADHQQQKAQLGRSTRSPSSQKAGRQRLSSRAVTPTGAEFLNCIS